MVTDDVLAAQRPRLLRAAIAAVAENGFAATTIADIVGRARVSRQAFYRQFDSKEACLIAAIDAGIETVAAVVAASGAETGDQTDFEASIRAVLRAYLRVSAAEPEFTRAWTLELPISGAAGLAKRNEYFDILADVLRRLHIDAGLGSAREALPETTYLALIGGCHELFYRYVAADRTSDLPDLEGAMASFVLAVLG